MKFLTLVPYYLVWHYTNGVASFAMILGNFVWFVYNFFSFSILLRTIFAPFKRLSEHYRGGLDVGSFFEVLIVNTLMRVVGFVVRLFVILIGLFAIVFVILLSAILFVGWFVLPIIIIFLLISGLIAGFK